MIKQFTVEESVFIDCMNAIGYDVVDNGGQGDCAFQALALLVWGNAEYHGQMRLWVVERLLACHSHYNAFYSLAQFSEHCHRMLHTGVAASELEL